MTTQHQGSLDDQLRELIDLANKEGLYDAADFITGILEKKEKKNKREKKPVKANEELAKSLRFLLNR